MVLNVVPLFLVNVLGARTALVGLIEGVAGSTASLLQVFSGSLSDRLGRRKGLAVAGYALSGLTKAGFVVAASWGGVAAARWGDRVGKGIRTAPRDALVADAIRPEIRGLAFGLHRAADTGGAVVGLAIAIGVVLSVQGGSLSLEHDAFRTLALLSLIPALAGVASLAFGAREVPSRADAAAPRFALRGLGRRFALFLAVSALFDLGNFSDAFLVLRAQERGLAVHEILLVLLGFNLVYALLSTPAGSLSDRIGRQRVLAGGWLLYAALYLGFALAESGGQLTALYLAYGAYYGLTAGTAKAFVADLVPPRLRGTAYGSYHAVLGLIDLPASLIAGVLWQGLGGWSGFGPAAPFVFGAGCALAAALLLLLLLREPGAAPVPRSRDASSREDATAADEGEALPDPEQPVVLPIEDAIDLHGFRPREIPEVVDAYLDAARERGFREVRLIHGRGKGVQRARLRQLLAGDPRVERFADAPPGRGGWGATRVWLRPL
jgi:MFS family permease